MFFVPQATYPPAASMIRPPAMLRRPPAQVSGVRQASTQVPPTVPHTQRVGECGLGQEERVCAEGGVGAWCWVGTGGESGLASVVTLPFASWRVELTLEAVRHSSSCGLQSPTDPVPGTNSLCGLANYCI